MPMSKRATMPPARVEFEIQDIHRRLRALEHDKRAYNEKVHIEIRKQRQAIEKLGRENRLMKLDLEDHKHSIEPQWNRKAADQQAITILSEKESLEDRFADETARKLSLEDEISRITASVVDARNQLANRGGTTSIVTDKQSHHKRVSNMEDRLHACIQRFNESLTGNRELRSSIELLRREKETFERIKAKLESEAAQRKREMTSIIDQANAAYLARDQVHTQMSALRIQAEREHTEFEREWLELGKLIDSDKKIKGFVLDKERKDEEDKIRAQKENTMNEKKNQQEFSTLEQQTLEGPRKDQQTKLTFFKEAFVRIQAATGIIHIDTLVDNFHTAASTNYSLFTFANSLAFDRDRNAAEIAHLQHQLSLHVNENPEKIQDERKRLFAEKIEQQSKNLEISISQTEIQLSQIYKIITKFHATIFPRSSTPHSNPSVKDYSLIISNMAHIEQLLLDKSIKFNALRLSKQPAVRQTHSKPSQSKVINRDSGMSAAQKHALKKAGVYFKLPSTVEEEDAGNFFEDKPMSYESLKEQAIKSFNIKQDKFKKPGNL